MPRPISPHFLRVVQALAFVSGLGAVGCGGRADTGGSPPPEGQPPTTQQPPTPQQPPTEGTAPPPEGVRDAGEPYDGQVTGVVVCPNGCGIAPAPDDASTVHEDGGPIVYDGGPVGIGPLPGDAMVGGETGGPLLAPEIPSRGALAVLQS